MAIKCRKIDEIPQKRLISSNFWGILGKKAQKEGISVTYLREYQP